jgi:hypothetical protein
LFLSWFPDFVRSRFDSLAHRSLCSKSHRFRGRKPGLTYAPGEEEKR